NSSSPTHLLLLDLVTGCRRAFLVGIGRIDNLAKTAVGRRNLGCWSPVFSLGRGISGPRIGGAVAIAAGRVAVFVFGDQVVDPLRAQIPKCWIIECPGRESEVCIANEWVDGEVARHVPAFC